MLSFKKGVLKISYEKEKSAKIFYEICFAVNLISIFAFYQIKLIATFTGILTFGAAIMLWVGNKKSKVIFPYNAAWYLLLIIYAALSSLWAPFVATDFIVWLLRMTVILLTIMSVSIYVDNVNDLERLITVFILSTALIIFIEIQSIPSGKLFDGLLGSNFSGFNANEIAFWTFCAEMMAFYKFYIRQKKAYLPLIIIFVIFIILSSSRKATASAIIGPVAVMLFSTYKKNYFLKIILIIMLTAGIVYFIMTNDIAYHVIGRRFDSMFDYMSTNSQKDDNSLYMRNYFRYVAKQLFFESPILGKGLGNFAYIINADYGTVKVYSHSNYWQILSEFGLIGFILYYSLYALCMVRLIKNAIKNKNRMCLVFAVLLAIITTMEVGLVTYNVKSIQIVIALIYAASYVGSNDGRRFKYIDNNKNNLEE